MFVYFVVDQNLRNLTLADLIMSRVCVHSVLIVQTNVKPTKLKKKKKLQIKIYVIILETNERLTSV